MRRCQRPNRFERAFFGDRPFGRGGDEDEWRFQATPCRFFDQFGAVAGRIVLGQLADAERTGFKRESGGGKQQHDRADRRRYGRRSAQGGGDQGHEAGALAVGRGADPPAIDVRAGKHQHRWAKQGRDQDREDDHERQGPGKRSKQGAGHDEQGDDHREHQRAAGEDDRAGRGAAGRPGCSDRVRPRGKLLAKAGDHQERVVHPQGQAQHRADDERDRADVEEAGEDRQQAARGKHRQGAKAERDRRRHRGAENQQQHDQQHRQRYQLGVLGAGDRLVLDRSREGGDARLVGANRRLDGFLEVLVEQREPSRPLLRCC